MNKANKSPLVKLLALLFVVGLLSGCASETFSHKAWQDAWASEDAASWQLAESGPVTLTNGKMEFALDAATTHFTIKDVVSGQTYSSVPETDGTVISDEKLKRSQSEIAITYYDSNSAEFVMTSAGDSVEKELAEVRFTTDAVRVIYTMGATAKLLVPQVFPVDVFENEICNEELLDRSNIRRIKRYYSLISPEDAQDEDLAPYFEKYPILKAETLYVVKDTIDTLNEIEISDACETVGFTEEDNAAIMKELGVEAAESDEPGFVVEVEYQLTEDGFTAEILTDRIQVLSENYHLCSVDFLEYFAAAGAEDKGYFLVPDGSGATIDFNGTVGTYSQKIYGNDLAIQQGSKTQLAKEALLPVFGLSYADGGVLAIVESGDANATVSANTLSESNPYNNAFFTFDICALDVTDLSEERSIPVYNLYGKHLQYEHPKIHYVLLSAQDADYVGMAAYLRTYYIENGLIPENAKTSGFFLDYNCLITENATVFGIPYTKRTVLSTLESITNNLAENEINGLSIRLLGYTKNGLEHGLYDRFSLFNKVGNKEELSALSKRINGLGGTLYLDADFGTVLSDGAFDGFSANADTVKRINRSLVVLEDYDLVTRQYVKSIFDSNLVSPTRFEEVAASYISSLEKELGKDNGLGLSYSSVGSLLYGDYTKKKDYDRTMTAETVEKVLAASAEQYPVLTENGYLYSLAGADYLLNSPIYSSDFDMASGEVPFYQLVIHGSIPYTGAPMNLATDRDNQLLRSLEYGADLYWSLTTSGDGEYSNTAYETELYSMLDTNSFQTISKLYSELGDYYAAISGKQMIRHTKLADDVYMTEYDGGAGVIVNYGDSDYVSGEYSVKAGGYQLWIS